MKLLTKDIKKRLFNNFRTQNPAVPIDFFPVVKLFTPDAQCTWLLTELDPDNNIAFGLCDLGFGSPELGYVDIDEITTIRGKLGLPVERDRYFTPTKSLKGYNDESILSGYIK